jgi:hypothetical protein
MNRRRHFVLIILPALILVASTTLYPGHFFYPASNQPHSVQTDLAVIFLMGTRDTFTLRHLREQPTCPGFM